MSHAAALEHQGTTEAGRRRAASKQRETALREAAFAALVQVPQSDLRARDVWGRLAKSTPVTDERDRIPGYSDLIQRLMAHTQAVDGQLPSPDFGAAQRLLASRARLLESERICALLDHVEKAEHAEYGGRLALDRVTWKKGGGVQAARGRFVTARWAVTPEKIVRRLSGCGRVKIAGRKGERAQVVTGWCDHRLCPMCAQRRRQKEVLNWEAPMRELAAAGCSLVFATTTHRAEVGDGPLALLEGERIPTCQRRAVGEEIGTATGGESLGAAFDRIQGSMRAVVQSRAYRDVYAAEVVGELLAYEATQSAKKGGGYRWHVHVHRLVALASEVDPHEWWSRWCDEWTRHADATVQGQQMSVLPNRPGEVERALRQVLKYPGKMDTMTAAGLVEFAAATIGRRWRDIRGALRKDGGAGRLAARLAVEELGELASEDMQEWAAKFSDELPEDVPDRAFEAVCAWMELARGEDESSTPFETAVISWDLDGEKPHPESWRAVSISRLREFENARGELRAALAWTAGGWSRDQVQAAAARGQLDQYRVISVRDLFSDYADWMKR